LQIVNPLNIENWDRLLEDHGGATIFHSSSWAKVLSETYRYNPKYFVRFYNDKLLALLPLMEIRSIFTGKRAVSLPFTDFSPPLYKDEESFAGLMEEAVKHGAEVDWKRIEIRGSIPGILTEQPAAEYLTHDLNLSSDEEGIRSRVRDSTMRQVRKAAREGVTIDEQPSTEGIQQYYRLNRLTRKRHGLPPQPFSFFTSIYKNIISKGMGTVYLATYRGKCVAGAIFFHFKDQVLFKFGASDNRYRQLGINNLVMWEAIKGCAGGHYRNLNFGRTDPDNHGLRRFKSGWGSTESKVTYYSYDLLKGSYVWENHLVKEWQKRILSRTPVPVLGLLGSLMYRHVG
jgi:hypothetical protein